VAHRKIELIPLTSCFGDRTACKMKQEMLRSVGERAFIPTKTISNDLERKSYMRFKGL